MTEQELIKGCKNGNRKYQKLLYEQYNRLFFGICLRYLPARMDAEDALQDGFINIFNKIDQYKYLGSFVGWMRKIIVNICITHIATNKSKYNYTELITEMGSVYKLNDTLSTDYLLNAIHELPVIYKTVFNMHEIDGYTHKEISKILDIPENTSKSHLLYARKYLQEKLKKDKYICNFS